MALLVSGAAGLQPAAGSQVGPGSEQLAPVTLRANPGRVCHTGRAPSYLNFDLVVGNRTADELKVQELRGIVLDGSGGMIERRLIWQQALSALSPDRTVAARSEALIFNPLLFAAARMGSRIRYEVDLAGPSGTRTASAVVVPQDCANRHAMRLPVAGRVLVYDGYDLHSHHRRSGYGGPEDAAQGITDNFQRYGLDLVAVDRAGRYFRSDGSRPELWIGWGAPVRAAAGGTVAAVHDGQPDNRVIGDVDKWVDRDMTKNPMTSYGNYVLVQHGPSEFSLVAHLQQGSVTVRKGQRVAPGQVIGRMGNSGASGGVHVHFERRTGPGIAGMETLPPFFGKVRVEALGKQTPAAVALDSGDVVVAD